MVSLPWSQLYRYEPVRKSAPLPPSTPLAGHRIASSVSEKPASKTTTATTPPPAAIPTATLRDAPRDSAISPANAKNPATNSGRPIEKIAKKPTSSSPAAEKPSKGGRQRADTRDERAAQIAVSTTKAATNGTRRYWGLLPCEPTIPRYRTSTAAAMMAAPTPAQRMWEERSDGAGFAGLDPPDLCVHGGKHLLHIADHGIVGLLDDRR